jgi:hypothetical protein
MGRDLHRDLVAQGECRRDVGMSLAAERRPDRVALGRLAMVDALLRSPDGTATIDAATPPDELAAEFADGGKWRGAVVLSLIRDGVAVITGTRRSVRPSRHRGYVSVLQLIDRTKAMAYAQQVATALAVTNETTPSVAADGVAMTDAIESTSQGDTYSEPS